MHAALRIGATVAGLGVAAGIGTLAWRSADAADARSSSDWDAAFGAVDPSFDALQPVVRSAYDQHVRFHSDVAMSEDLPELASAIVDSRHGAAATLGFLEDAYGDRSRARRLNPDGFTTQVAAAALTSDRPLAESLAIADDVADDHFLALPVNPDNDRNRWYDNADRWQSAAAEAIAAIRSDAPVAELVD